MCRERIGGREDEIEDLLLQAYFRLRSVPAENIGYFVRLPLGGLIFLQKI